MSSRGRLQGLREKRRCRSGSCERRDRFLRELNAPDSEGDCMNVHKYYWGCPDGHIFEYWSQLEEEDRGFQEYAEWHSKEVEACSNLSRAYEEAVQSSMGYSSWGERHRDGSSAECPQSCSKHSKSGSDEDHHYYHNNSDY